MLCFLWDQNGTDWVKFKHFPNPPENVVGTIILRVHVISRRQYYVPPWRQILLIYTYIASGRCEEKSSVLTLTKDTSIKVQFTHWKFDFFPPIFFVFITEREIQIVVVSAQQKSFNWLERQTRFWRLFQHCSSPLPILSNIAELIHI